MPKKIHRQLSEEGLRLVARQFQVLSEPARLKLLAVLEEGEQNVTALVQLTGLSQANISKHLGILHDVGMVDRRKEGPSSFYFISDPKISELCDLMCSKLEKEFDKKSTHFR
ncbi:metalloregulator ArsR/SmtB family transcription factor [soil metagenome]